jgi:RND family efflux transporter MFP subunit
MLPSIFYSGRSKIAMAVAAGVFALAGVVASATAAAPVATLVAALAATLVTVPVRASSSAPAYLAEGVVEAVRQSVIASQVAGAISALPVKAGDAVRSGQLLAQIDARAASQDAAASRSQTEAARATLQAAQRDFERQQQLFARHYISQANLDQAESQFKQARAQANAQIAQADAVQTRSGFYALQAPYAGLLASVEAMPGEMAMPGRTLMTLYDPAAMRVRVRLPQARASALLAGAPVEITIAGLARPVQASKLTLLPQADESTHTVTLRLDLPPGVAGLVPGMFARASLPQAGAAVGAGMGTGGATRLLVPASAVFRRAELFAVYVLGANGQPLLRQVRPGPLLGNEREILSGVGLGEQVLLDPLAAGQAGGARHE